jgi:hypothetical protein
MALMGKIRWAIFAAFIILLFTLCKFNVHQSHFNLFILGLFFVLSVIIMVFWLMSKRESLDKAEPMRDNEEIDVSDVSYDA